jgi:tagaturonate reductase
MTRRIVQFGTSRFLQAHVDLFIHEAGLQGQDIGPITVVKTSSGADRAGRIAALKRGLPYPVRIRGLSAGKAIDRTIEVASVGQAFDARDEWPAVVRCFAREADIAISNVAERGYEPTAGEADHDLLSHSPPRSFPAKLLALLLARHKEGGRPLLFLPTELISRNGRRLAASLAELAVESRQSDAFRTWLAASVVFADTLVDRIVSEAIDPVGAVAEPYALWAIERGAFVEPFRHPAVQMVDDIEPLERLKLHILNLGHTVLADDWMKRRGTPNETVRGAVGDPATSQRLSSIYSEEVLPGFALRGMGDAARRYIDITLERFRNPYLEHLLADIEQNHPTKIKNRIVAFLDWARERDGNFCAPRLGAMLRIDQPGYAKKISRPNHHSQ